MDKPTEPIPSESKDLAYLNKAHPHLTKYDPQAGTSSLLMCVSTGFILLMQAGFALVENGSVRAKNSKNILIKNMFDVCIGAILFWVAGYSIAFGKQPSGFAGGEAGLMAGVGFDRSKGADHYAMWIFQFSFAATAATIVSGSLAERTKIPTYVVFSAFMTGWVYPVVVAWTWGKGWLFQRGFHDFAGTGIVHMVGGVAGFVGAAILRPRWEKKMNREPVNMKDIEEVITLSGKVDDP